MKTLKNTTTLLAQALIIGSAALSYAGNRPAETYPQGVLVSSNSSVQMAETNPWHKGVQQYVSGVVVAGPTYNVCPVSHTALNSKHPGAVVTLSNGKMIMLANAGLKSVVEADLKKYAPFMFGGSSTGETSATYAQASVGLRADANLK